ncbi:hypothetical protein LTR56_009399 [Elasticomyces elasticus]|nr:hypothetical protein LTR56_009399 [Elasticomyces elasticus]KAK3645834.1 hypothetical protein LTR22_014499 [Elasticomyces elasticus]KAK4931079.1 hypothetical protein LTR49_002495 [Elasticomyces elasticus]KAK5765546.1 hypothetical protein LTS12_004298 [Elasticomyces elasticus]
MADFNGLPHEVNNENIEMDSRDQIGGVEDFDFDAYMDGGSMDPNFDIDELLRQTMGSDEVPNFDIHEAPNNVPLVETQPSAPAFNQNTQTTGETTNGAAAQTAQLDNTVMQTPPVIQSFNFDQAMAKVSRANQDYDQPTSQAITKQDYQRIVGDFKPQPPYTVMSALTMDSPARGMPVSSLRTPPPSMDASSARAGAEDEDESPVVHATKKIKLDVNADAPKKVKKARKVSTAPQSHDNEPEYIEDIANPDAALMSIAHPDTVYFTKISPPYDDLATVKTQMHAYAKRFFDAIKAPGAQDFVCHKVVLPQKAEHVQNMLTRFANQQKKAKEDISKLLTTPLQAKEARANCILAFAAAVFMHEVGVLSEEYAIIKAKPDRKSVHYPHADLESICSVRLEKMIKVVRDFKVAAVDILEGKNLKEFARDPDWYLTVKTNNMKSNATRALTSKELKAAAKQASEDGAKAEETKGKKSKRKFAEMEDEDEGGESDEVIEEE